VGALLIVAAVAVVDTARDLVVDGAIDVVQLTPARSS
jgi:hypothetical protein